MQRHLCTLSRMPGLSTVSTFYSQDIRIQQAELCPWFEQTSEVNILSWLLVAYLLGYSLLTLTERSLNNFLCLISVLVFLDLPSLYFGFFLGNFAVPHGTSLCFLWSSLPHIWKKGKAFIWESHLGETCGAGVSERCMTKSSSCHYCQFLPHKNFHLRSMS